MEKQTTPIETEEPDMTFSKELRKATKEVHKVSDALVNAKFALALSDESVWADALLCFYEIYKYLENNLSEKWIPNEFRRTEAFEKDLAYFLGENWKEDYEPRDSIKKYLTHLDEVRAKGGETLLFAYAFQMYMALMSGGQLLQKKRLIKRKLWMGKTEEQKVEQKPANPDAPAGDLEARPMPIQVNFCAPGCEATYFPQKIADLKAILRTILNREMANFDEATKEAFIEESRNVFIYNGEVVRSVRGVTKANIRKLAIFAVFVIGIYFAIKLARN